MVEVSNLLLTCGLIIDIHMLRDSYFKLLRQIEEYVSQQSQHYHPQCLHYYLVNCCHPHFRLRLLNLPL
jgi:hypothetical protein